MQGERLPAPSRESEGLCYAGLAYLNVNSISDEGEPIPDATVHHVPGGPGCSNEVGGGHATASSEVLLE